VSFVRDMVRGPNGWLRLLPLLAAAKASSPDLIDTHQLKRACWSNVCEACGDVRVVG
jgi:hypothetical protein